MGVPQLFQWLAQRHGAAVRPLRPGDIVTCDALYIDFNSVVHQSTRHAAAWAAKVGHVVLDDDAIIRACTSALDALLSDRVQPSRLLYIAVDGLPPRAKLHQQRARRYMAAWRRANAPQAGAATGAAAAATQLLSKWDSNAITPGTAFMARLSCALSAYAPPQVPGVSWDHLQVHVSYSGVPGEGEQKIFTHLRAVSHRTAHSHLTGAATTSHQPAPAAAAAAADHHYCSVVHGVDADLLLMAMSSPAHRRPGHSLYVMREMEEGAGPSSSHLVDAGHLAHEVARRVLGEGRCEREPTEEEEELLVRDFVMLAALAGNDFVPSLPGLSIREGALDLLLRIHAQARVDLRLGPLERLACGGPELLCGVRPEVLARVLQGVAREEEALMRRADKRYFEQCVDASYVRPGRRELEAYPLHHPPFPAGTIFREQPPEDGHGQGESSGGAWRTSYYRRVLGVLDAAGGIVRDMCVSYVAGLAWSVRYLVDQKCAAHGWWYAHTHAPCSLDVAHALCDVGGIVAAVGAELEATAALPEEAVREPAWQLLMVLPPSSLARLLPVGLRGVLDDPDCKYMFPSSFRLSSTYLRVRLWECTPILPPLDIKRLGSAIMLAQEITLADGGGEEEAQ